MTDPSPAPSPTPAGSELTAAMAEFEALRAEIVSSRGLQKNVVTVGLAAFGALFSFALGRDGDRALLLVVAPLGLVLSVFYLSETFLINRMGSYLRETVWPVVQRLTAYPHSWEAVHHRRGTWVEVGASALLLDGAPPALFLGAGLVAVVNAPPMTTGMGVFQWTCVVLTVLVPAGYGSLFLAQTTPHDGH